MRIASSNSTGPTSSDIETCGPVDQNSGQLTLFAEAFPVSRTPWLADVPAPQTTATCGPSSPVSFACLNPDGSWRKTCQGFSQVTLDGSLERFSETWPRAGMTRSGIAYQRQPSVPLTVEIASGLWPTPQAQMPGAGPDSPKVQNLLTGNRHSFYLTQAVEAERQLPGVITKLWPTPCAADGKDQASGDLYARVDQVGRQRGVSSAPFWTPDANCWKGGNWGNQINQQVPGSLNPTWVEWLMGYPLGWTVCEDSATRLSRRSPSGSPRASRTRKG